MEWIKFLPGKKIIHSTGKTNSLHEAILIDHTNYIGITIWRELTQSIEEGRKYKFYNLNLRNFLGLKLSTTKLNRKICCTELVGTNLTVDEAYPNDKCGKPVATVPGERIETYINCNNTMRVKKM